MESGTRLGPYEVLEKLGAGGMGEVYRARDSRLERDVAIKVLPGDLGADDERLARFEREAKLLASLNHTNIAAIYDVETSGDAPFIAMELVDGETLGDRIERNGPIAVDEALRFAEQLIEGLRAAHDNGVVHRDLKPANIQVTESGALKILDFGLAKPSGAPGSQSGSRPDQTQSPTMLQATGAGMIMGTAAYMSPEQAKGRAVDKRADIWAFGAVLGEMLTGKPLFAREDLSETLASVIRDEPDLDALPERVRPLVAECLQKDPAKRLRDIGDARLLVGNESRPSGDGVAAPNVRLPWAVAGGAIVVAVLAIILGGGLQPNAVAEPYHLEVPWPTDVGSSDLNAAGVFTMAPNGRDLVFLDDNQLWLRRGDSLKARVIDNTEGATYPFWSPDGDWIAFFRGDELRKIQISSDLEQLIADVSLGRAVEGRGGDWGPDGTILYGTNVSVIYRVSAAGGVPEAVTRLPEGAPSSDAHRYPQILTGGESFLFLYLTGSEAAGTYLGTLDGADPVMVRSGAELARYAAPLNGSGPGHLIFREDSAVMAQAFDAAAGTLGHGPVPIADGLGVAANTGFLSLSVTPSALAFASEQATRRDLAWADRRGGALDSASSPAMVRGFHVAPDEATAILSTSSGVGAATGEIVLATLGEDDLAPFTFGEDPGWGHGTWSRDGERIAYTTFGNSGLAAYELRVKAADMTGEPTVVTSVDDALILWDWSPNDEAILATPNFGFGHLTLYPLDGGAPEALMAGQGSTNQGQFSPDGNWLAYTSDASGRPEVYVQPHPAGGAVRQISRAGGEMPKWAPDGGQLFFVSLDGDLIAVSVTLSEEPSGPVMRTGQRETLFGGLAISGTQYRQASYAPVENGERFLVMRELPSPKAPITVIQNWQSILDR